MYFIISNLEGSNSSRLEAEISFEILGDLTDESLEGQLADEEFSGLLVSADFSESDSTRSVSVGLLDAASGWGRFSSSLNFMKEENAWF